MAVQLTHHHNAGARGPRHVVAFRRKRVRVWLVAGIVAVFAGLAWTWAFQRVPGAMMTGGAPLLVADRQPTRERPANPGGLQVVNIDPLSYDSGRAPPKIEDILPAPEKPLPQPAPAVAEMAPTPAAPSAQATTSPNRATPTSAPVEQASAAMPSAIEVSMTMAPPPPKPHPPRLMAARAAPVKPVPRYKPQPVAVRVTPKPPPAPRAVAVPAVATVGSGGYLQLAAVRSPSDALRIGKRLRRRYGGLLRAFAFNYRPIDLGARGVFYRITAGPMAPSRAVAICTALKRRGADCLVTGR
ncbi:MAG: SPOR domain-containing protein [Stellaceae bacterium]